MPEGTSTLSPIVCGHSFRHTIAHEPVVVDGTSHSVNTFVRDGSEFRGFGEVVHDQAYEGLSGAFCGEGGFGVPSPSFHRFCFDLTQRERFSRVNVKVAKATAHMRGTNFCNLLKLLALDLAGMALLDIGSNISFDARPMVVLLPHCQRLSNASMTHAVMVGGNDAPPKLNWRQSKP